MGGAGRAARVVGASRARGRARGRLLEEAAAGLGGGVRLVVAEVRRALHLHRAVGHGAGLDLQLGQALSARKHLLPAVVGDELGRARVDDAAGAVDLGQEVNVRPDYQKFVIFCRTFVMSSCITRKAFGFLDYSLRRA